MKAYKLTVVVIDHDGLGGEDIADVIENARYPNHCIVPEVARYAVADIGEWHDDHPLNRHGADMVAPFGGAAEITR